MAKYTFDPQTFEDELESMIVRHEKGRGSTEVAVALLTVKVAFRKALKARDD